MTLQARLRWIRAGIAAGLATAVLYPVLLFVPLPLAATAAVAALLGPLIGLTSLGLREILRHERESVAASLGAYANLVAGVFLTAMVLVQLSVRYGPQSGGGEGAAAGIVGVWLGLDVGWDVHIGLGTICFALAMRRHPRFGLRFAAPGLLLGAAELVLNLVTFPTPPPDAGLVDVTLILGAWYVAAALQSWRSLGWVRGGVAIPSPDVV